MQRSGFNTGEIASDSPTDQPIAQAGTSESLFRIALMPLMAAAIFALGMSCLLTFERAETSDARMQKHLLSAYELPPLPAPKSESQTKAGLIDAAPLVSLTSQKQ